MFSSLQWTQVLRCWVLHEWNKIPPISPAGIQHVVILVIFCFLSFCVQFSLTKAANTGQEINCQKTEQSKCMLKWKIRRKKNVIPRKLSFALVFTCLLKHSAVHEGIKLDFLVLYTWKLCWCRKLCILRWIHWTFFNYYTDWSVR